MPCLAAVAALLGGCSRGAPQSISSPAVSIPAPECPMIDSLSARSIGFLGASRGNRVITVRHKDSVETNCSYWNSAKLIDESQSVRRPASPPMASLTVQKWYADTAEERLPTLQGKERISLPGGGEVSLGSPVTPWWAATRRGRVTVTLLVISPSPEMTKTPSLWRQGVADVMTQALDQASVS